MPAAAEPAAETTPEVHAEPPMTPVGEIYAKALAKEQGQEETTPAAKPETKEAAPAKPAKAAEVKPEAKVSEPAKPESALDAALAEPAPEEEKKGETPVESALKDLPETLPNDKRGENWAKARSAIANHEKTIGQLKSELAQATKAVEAAKSTPPETAKQVAELQAQLDKYKDAVVAVNVELDPDFRAKFVDGREVIVNKAVSKANAYGANGDALKEALGMPEGRARSAAIKEALSELDDVDRSRVLQFVGEVEKLDDERADLQKNPQQAWDKLTKAQAEARQKQAEQAEAYKQDVFDRVSKTLPSKLTLLRPVDPSVPGGKEWNDSVAEIKENAYKLLGNEATPEQLAEAALWATAGPKIQEKWMADRTELAKLRTALKEYEESEPGFKGGKPPKKSGKEAAIETDPGELYKQAMANFNGNEGD